MKSRELHDHKKLNIVKVARAIEADMGEALPDVRQALKEAKAGLVGRIHTPEEITRRSRGRPRGSVQAVTKEPVKLRLDADVLAALRASGEGWQTRVNDALRANLLLAGQLPGSR